MSQRSVSLQIMNVQPTANENSDTMLIHGAYGNEDHHHLASEDPGASQKMQTNFTQAKWLLPKITLEGRQPAPEEEFTFDNGESAQKPTHNSEGQSGLLPNIANTSSDAQLIMDDKELPSEAN